MVSVQLYMLHLLAGVSVFSFELYRALQYSFFSAGLFACQWLPVAVARLHMKRGGLLVLATHDSRTA